MGEGEGEGEGDAVAPRYSSVRESATSDVPLSAMRTNELPHPPRLRTLRSGWTSLAGDSYPTIGRCNGWSGALSMIRVTPVLVLVVFAARARCLAW
jgi:hypothetical protein